MNNYFFFIDLFLFVCYYVFNGDNMDVYDYKYIRDKFHFLCEREFTYLSIDDEKSTVCKIFEPDFIEAMLDEEYDLEDMVLNGSGLVDSDSIIVPNSIVYGNKKFVGYLMPYFDGVCLRRYSDEHFIHPIKLAEIYKKIEKTVKESSNIVFPDLLTDGNILINGNHDIKLIDFDGLQIDYFRTPVFTRYMGDKNKYNNTKYKDGDYFTKELDVKSLVYLYIKMLLDVELEIIDMYDGIAQKRMIDKFIKDFDIQVDDLVHCITALYDDKKDNIYLGNVVDIIGNEFFPSLVNEDGKMVKKLVRR